jgi:uncharacterized membrane protein
MQRSTKHAIAQRLLGLVGIVLFAGPIWFRELDFVPPFILLLGWLMLMFGMLSSFGIGPWGRYFKAILAADNEAYFKSLEPKQPWQ